MGYSIGTLIYPKILILSDPTHMMNMGDPIAMSVETLRIDSEYSLKEEFTELMRTNP